MSETNDSRIEKLLKAILGQEVQLEPRESRVERLLYAILTGGSHDEPTLSEIEDILLCILHGERYEGPTSSRINDMLKVKANGGSYDEPRLSRIEELIYEWINGGDISTYTGTLPATLQTVEGYLTGYKIYGNTKQIGTPTPENPIMPTFCGVRTEQLFDISGVTLGKWYTSSGALQNYAYGAISGMTEINEKQLTIKWHGLKPYSFSFVWFDSNKDFLSRSHYGGTSGLKDEYTTTVPLNVVYFIIQMSNGTNTSDSITREQLTSYQTMLNTGSTALPYEPYGYKLPMVSRTENLFYRAGEISSYYISESGEISAIGSSRWYVSDFIQVQPNVTYTFTYNSNPGNAAYHAFYNDNRKFISTVQMSTHTFTTPNDAKYMRFSYRAESFDIMLNLGSTALPYEPYGYKSSPIYLGEVETTRRIKKLVLTGEENITKHSVQNDIIGVRIPTPSSVLGASIVICSHYKGVLWAVYNGYRGYGIVASNPSAGNTIVYMSAPDSEHNTLSTFVQWIKDQYLTGTPVTVWYVLAEPETGIVNEPLMKIGDYADTIDSTQTTAQIPTFAGTTVIDYDGEPKPDKVELTYRKQKG